jgi:hypothetical protein
MVQDWVGGIDRVGSRRGGGNVEGRLVHHSAPYRYVWPSELDLMARLTGFRLRDRWETWTRAPFTSDSTEQIAVYEKAT